MGAFEINKFSDDLYKYEMSLRDKDATASSEASVTKTERDIVLQTIHFAFYFRGLDPTKGFYNTNAKRKTVIIAIKAIRDNLKTPLTVLESITGIQARTIAAGVYRSKNMRPDEYLLYNAINEFIKQRWTKERSQ